MAKRKPNQEVFNDGSKEIILTADFGFLEAVNSYGTDVSILYSDLANGMLPPDKIRDILICSIGDEIEDKKKYAEYLISEHGLADCGMVAWQMLNIGMVGNKNYVKKLDGEQKKELEEAIQNLLSSPSKSLKKVGALWVAQLLTFTILACMISRLFDQYIA